MAKKSSKPELSYIVRPLSPDDGGGFLCEVLDHPGCYGDGTTPEAAMADAQNAVTAWKKVAEEFGDKSGTSGQWRLRVPRTLHRRLHERAKTEGVSLNTLAVSLLSEGLGERAQASYRAGPQYKKRAAR
ncbi:MAG: type II toxin-antitoxin system HicB family antitoxin [Rhodospirillaceae bacterium]|nr:type II toxin-antitoxin system HicB family antitoxin [Rhodospirillaceae bacterium]